ncbi:MAG TPA: hypothetical protein VF310_04650 [Vicinamibacteria bacterium]
MAADPLMCPGCATTYPLDERFCARCGMPLVYTRGRPTPESERHERARKIRPQYAEGELVGIARGRNQAEAEFIQGLLLEEGVPSLLRRSRGFDVPDYLAAGPRDVLVPASGAATAREVLLQAELLPTHAADGVASPARLLIGLLVAVVVVAVVLWLGTELVG